MTMCRLFRPKPMEIVKTAEAGQPAYSEWWGRHEHRPILDGQTYRSAGILLPVRGNAKRPRTC